ncbi:MAG: hypothetical protein R2867_28095 [Caldilineaceae bacterium]
MPYRWSGGRSGWIGFAGHAFYNPDTFGEAYLLVCAATWRVGDNATLMQIMLYLHFDRFFNDPLWIISHNVFHSLLINGLLIGIGWWAYQRAVYGGLALFGWRPACNFTPSSTSSPTPAMAL